MALAQLCHLLAGLLAIELATANLRVLSPRAVLERLDDMWVSTGGARPAGAATAIRTTLGWSPALLSEEERRMFLEALPVVESAEGRPEQVARLLGAVHVLRQAVGANVYAYYRPDESLRESAEAAARSALGEAGFEAEFAEVGVLGLGELLGQTQPQDA